jgi:hypothetical protein
VTTESEAVETVRSGKVRRLHKAFLRYHDPANWEILREGLLRMGRGDLIGNSERHLVPRHSSTSPALEAIKRRTETPGPDRLAKKFGQNKPRPGGAVERNPAIARQAGKKATPSKTGRR